MGKYNRNYLTLLMNSDVYILKSVNDLRSYKYNNFEELKMIFLRLINQANKDNIEDIVSPVLESIVDVELKPLETRNIHASNAYNKRVWLCFSYIFALKDIGYNLTNIEELIINYITKIKNNLNVKRQYGLNTQIGDPVNFYKVNRNYSSDLKYEGTSVCDIIYQALNQEKNKTNIKRYDVN